MGLKKLNSEYDSRYKTFAVHRPNTTKAKISSHPSDSAPEALESSRRAGLLSNQFLNVSEPALQRRRIVPYKRNHNILSTSTVKELNDRDWLEAVGNGDTEQTSAGNVEKDAKKTEDTEYSSSFAKLTVKEDSPIILASKTKIKQKTQDHRRQSKRSAASQRPYMEKSPERLPPAGIPTYIADPQDKRLLRPCDDLLYPVNSPEQNRNSQTEYSERYKSSVPERKNEKPIPKYEETSNIDLAAYKKALLQRNDAYGLSVRPNTSLGKEQSSTPRAKHRQSYKARSSSLDCQTSGSYTEAREKELAKTYTLSKSKHNDDKLRYNNKTRGHSRTSPRRSLDEESLSSIHSAHYLEATRKLKKEPERRSTYKNKLHEIKTKNPYAESVSSRNSQSSNNETKHKKGKLIPADTRPRSAKNVDTRRDSQQESVSSIHSARSFDEHITRRRNEKLQTEKRSSSTKNDRRKRGTEAWKEQPVSKVETRGSARISRDTERSRKDIYERGRSPTPEMRTAGQSRRHHLDITTGSNNPLATGPDPRQTKVIGIMKYERAAYDPSRYSDVGESLTSSRSFATWSDRGS